MTKMRVKSVADLVRISLGAPRPDPTVRLGTAAPRHRLGGPPRDAGRGSRADRDPPLTDRRAIGKVNDAGAWRMRLAMRTPCSGARIMSHENRSIGPSARERDRPRRGARGDGSHHRSLRARRQLAAARAQARARANAPPWSRPTPMASAPSPPCGRSRPPAAALSSSPRRRRASAFAPSRRAPSSMCSRACRAAAPARSRPRGCARFSPRSRRFANGRRSAAPSAAVCPAALQFDTGMNRLGLSLRDAAAAAAWRRRMSTSLWR